MKDYMNALLEYYTNEHATITSWVERIQKLLESGKLDPASLEEFINEHERDQNVIDPDLLDITNPKYDYKWKVRDEFESYWGDNWLRTDVFNSYEGTREQLEQQLHAKAHALGIYYFAFDDDGTIIIMKDDNGLYNWINEFDSVNDVVKFLKTTSNNILQDFGDTPEESEIEMVEWIKRRRGR